MIVQLISCLGIFVLEKTIHAVIAPLLTQWNWTTTGQFCGNPCIYSVPNITLLPELQDLSPNGYATDKNDSDSHRGMFSCDECQENGMTSRLKLSGYVAAFLLIQPIVNALLAPLSGILGDKKGYDYVLLIGLLTYTGTALLFALFTNFPALFSANVLMGIAGACCTPNVYAKLNKLYPPDNEKGKLVLGLALTTNVFSFIGPAMSGALYEHLGQLITFVTLFLPLELLLIITVVWSACVWDHREKGRKVDETTNNECSFILDHKDTKESLVNDRCFGNVLNHPQIVILTGAILVSWIPRKCIEATLAVWMYETFNSGPSDVGIVLGAGAIGVLAANGFGTWFVIRFPQYLQRYISLNLALCGVPIALTWTANSSYIVSFYLGVYIFFACSVRYAVMGVMSRLAERMDNVPRSKVMGIASMGLSLPSFIGPVISIPLYNFFGFRVMTLMVGMMCVLYGAVVWLVTHDEQEINDTPNYMVLSETPKIITKPYQLQDISDGEIHH
ncbi:probable vesicular acetylcholine transporter-B [Amphiura filiformis]|uniref:probable vesicular acetylcholine transporter-B n=1 Tax=Amphiura filiformis TaxID=82378 RepID=UPI003B21E43C